LHRPPWRLARWLVCGHTASGQEGGKLAENWANAGSRRFLQFFRQLGVREVRAGRRTRLSHSPAAPA